MEKVRRKRLGRRILGVVLSVALVLGLMPEITGSKMMVQAAENSEPAVTAYATKDQLMNTFQQDGNNTTIGKIVFGKNYEGNPQEWYILGKDTNVSGDNIAVFATSLLSGNQSFVSSWEDIVYTSDMGVYSSPPSDVYPNHYGSSALRNTLRTLATNTAYFTAAEQDLMQATTVTTRDIKNDTTYTVTDVLYAVSANYLDYWVLCAGANNDKVLKTESFWNNLNYFWLRDATTYWGGLYGDGSDERKYVYMAYNGDVYGSKSQAGVQPATNIDMTNVAFASVAKAAQSGTEAGTIPAGTAMTLRLDGSNRNIGSVVYSTESDNIVVTRGNTTGTVSLVVQGNDGTNDWYYSKAISEDIAINVTDIEAALASNGISDVKLLRSKIWLETTTNGLAYAVTAETTNPYNEPVCADGVYLISNVQELCWFVLSVSRGLSDIDGKLTADIDLTGVKWTQMESFSGTFDGDGHTIKGMCMNAGLADGARHGFIRTLESSGVVKNLTFTNADIFNHEGDGAISAVIAYTNKGTVQNCWVTNSTIQHGDYSALGVVVGVNTGTISDCVSVSNTVKRRYSSSKAICGFVWSNSGTIQDCYNYDCSYSGSGSKYAFTQSNTGTITNCYYYEPSETLSDTIVTKKTAEQFASGAVCYLLNGSTSTGDLTWGQTLGTDSYPVFKTENNLVCKNPTEEIYSNHNQFNEAGFCVTCGGGYEKPELIDGVYQIANAGQLCWFEKYVNSGNQSANAKLTADIDMENITWTTICETALYYNGYGEECDNGYSGTFDGGGHVISNLTVTSSADAEASVGLFGTVSGTVKNLGVENFTLVDGGMDMRAGAIVGQLIKTGKVSDCYVKGADIQTGDHVAGGIAGCVYEGTVENCYVVDATISGASGRFGYVTGDVCADGNSGDGTDRPGVVKNCFTDGSALTSTRKGAGSVDGGEAGVSEERFASGEVAYLLNGSTSTGTLAWYQNLNESADAYPVLDSEHGKVYYGYYKCLTEVGYGNSEEITAEPGGQHTWENSECSVCGKVCTHTWENDECSVCGKVCTHIWEYGECSVCGKVCTHTWEDSECSVCGKACTHTWENDECSVCGKVCTHTWEYGECSVCGKVCSHTWVDGECTVCGSMPALFITLDNGEAFADNEYTFANNVHTINTDKKVTITGTTTTETVVIASGVNASITLNNVSIDVSSIEDVCAFKIADGSSGNVTITLADGTKNILKSGKGCAGLQKNRVVGTLTICGGANGTGSLEATGGYMGAGIGSSCQESVSGITIRGGIVTAQGGNLAAGIGGGSNHWGSDIEISGGTVTAKGGDRGAGIGGGTDAPGSNIRISGGSVNAVGGGTGKAIGGGGWRPATTPTSDGTTPVYLLEIANENNLDIVINDTDYPDKHFDEKKIYAYLPAKTEAEPNGVTVGDAFTGYYYDTDASEWKQTTSHTHEDGDNNCVCDECQYVYKHMDDNTDGKCDVCGTFMDGIGAKLAGYSLSLDGNIGVNFYMELDASVLADDTAYMQFTLPNVAEPVQVLVNSVEGSAKTVAGKTYYVFTCEVAAKEMTDTIKAQIFCSNGTEAGTEYEYSVRDYAVALMGRNDTTDEEKALAKAMLNYGAYAQTYFGYNTANPANLDYEDTELLIDMSTMGSYVPEVEVTAGSDLTYVGSTIRLEAQLMVRHYFKLAEGVAAPNGLSLYTAPAGETVTGTYYYYESDGIAFGNWGTKTDYTAVAGNSISYCPLSYVTTVVANTNADLTTGEEAVKLQNLMKALYLYYQAVWDYRQANAN